MRGECIMIRNRLRLGAFLCLGLILSAVGAAFGQAGWQQIVSPAGTELVQVSVPGSAYQNFVYLNQIRNASGHQLVATGSTVASAPTNAVGSLIATGAITTWNVTTPASPYDGELFTVANATGSAFTSNVTVTAATGSTMNTAYSSQTIAAASSVAFQYDAASAKWYRIR